MPQISHETYLDLVVGFRERAEAYEETGTQGRERRSERGSRRNRELREGKGCVEGEGSIRGGCV